MPETNREAIVRKVSEITARVASREGMEVVDVQLLGGGGSRLLRIFIDRPEGVTHADCQFISEHVGTVLDVEDVIPGGKYTLEVSSPGVERRLTKPHDFERFLGRKARIALRRPVENQKNWTGTLKAFEQGMITLETAPGKSIEVPFEEIERANLKFEW